MFHGWLTNALSGDPIFVGIELLIIGAIVGCVAYLLGHRSRGQVHAWAAHGGWEIVGCRRCLLLAGGQIVVPGVPVYHVSLRSRSGRERAAFVRVGNYMIGALANEVAVEWVEPAGR